MFSHETHTTYIYPLSLHDALPIFTKGTPGEKTPPAQTKTVAGGKAIVVSTSITVDEQAALYFSVVDAEVRSEEHTSELQSRFELVCRLLLEKKKNRKNTKKKNKNK